MDKQVIQMAIKKLVGGYELKTIFIYGSQAWGKPGDNTFQCGGEI